MPAVNRNGLLTGVHPNTNPDFRPCEHDNWGENTWVQAPRRPEVMEKSWHPTQGAVFAHLESAGRNTFHGECVQNTAYPQVIHQNY